nr:TOBE domain-containing protein [Mesorhizobium sp.]
MRHAACGLRTSGRPFRRRLHWRHEFRAGQSRQRWRAGSQWCADIRHGSRNTFARRCGGRFGAAERIRLFPPPETANRVAGIVEALAYHGLDLQLHVRTALSQKPFLVRVTADAADRRPVASGDAVELGWDAADVRIFAD